MAKFAYNNAKNVSIGHTLFKLNSGYYFRLLFEDETNPWSRSCFANLLAKELKELMQIYC